MPCEGASLSREKHNRDADQKYCVKCNLDHDTGTSQVAEKGRQIIGWLAVFDILGRKFGLRGNRTKCRLGTWFYVFSHLVSKIATRCPNIDRRDSSHGIDMVSLNRSVSRGPSISSSVRQFQEWVNNDATRFGLFGNMDIIIPANFVTSDNFLRDSTILPERNCANREF